jgi:hypothetical protein
MTIRSRPKDLDALPGLLRIARSHAGHHETRGGRAARASMTFDVFARCGPRPQRDPGHSSASN